jgi:hypothetical protein
MGALPQRAMGVGEGGQEVPLAGSSGLTTAGAVISLQLVWPWGPWGASVAGRNQPTNQSINQSKVQYDLARKRGSAGLSMAPRT